MIECGLFVANKPVGISSNHFLMRLKRKYQFKKCGYSGTLDPFASGALIVGVGAYTRLFSYLKKDFKTYEATLWLGARSETLDLEGVQEVQEISPFALEKIQEVLQGLLGEIEYFPPKFSAKHINGKRAYQLAREGKEFEMKLSKMQIKRLEILHYTHPFLHFRVEVSEGGYVRSLGEMIAQRLGVNGALSALRRVAEGEIQVCSKELQKINALEYLDCQKIALPHLESQIYEGKKIGQILSLELKVNTLYLVEYVDFFSIISVNENQEIKYHLNRIPKC